MILIQLDEATRDELKSLRRQELPPRVRDRLEMVLLSSIAWSPARIATHLGYCAPTVRSVLKDFLDRGTAALFPRRTGPPPDLRRRHQVTQALTDLLAGADLDQQAIGHSFGRAGNRAERAASSPLSR